MQFNNKTLINRLIALVFVLIKVKKFTYDIPLDVFCVEYNKTLNYINKHVD